MIYIIPTDTCFGIACSIDDKASYDKIYKIKERSKDKPLAIMIDDFSHLSSLLNKKQIDFLKNYTRPWTILIDRNRIIHAKLEINKKYKNYPLGKVLDIETLKNHNSQDFLSNIINNKIINSKNYSKISFRIANNEVEKKLIFEIGTIFLTSANISGENEIYTVKELEEIFGKNKDIQILAKKDLQKVSPSDIFEFVGESTEIKYLRKN